MDKLASEYKVLIVDDVPTNVMLVQAILKKEGYTLLTCDSGTKVLRIANEKHPNLILLDIMMPEMDGYEVLQHLKSNPETTDIPVIIMSALSDMQSIVKGYQLGATEYVTKPFQRAGTGGQGLDLRDVAPDDREFHRPQQAVGGNLIYEDDDLRMRALRLFSSTISSYRP